MRDECAPLPTVVCVHGAGGGGWEWAIWARVLAANGFAVLAPDLVRVDAGLAATRFADYREQVTRWCVASPDRIVLIGASLGGLLALGVAARVNAAAVLLINPMPPGGMPFDVRDDGAGIVPWASRHSFASTRRAMVDADAAAHLHAYRKWRDESVAVLRDACAGIEWVRPACPVRVTVGLLDSAIAPACGRALAADLAADLDTVAEGDHLSPLLGRGAARSAESATQWLLNRASRVTVDGSGTI